MRHNRKIPEINAGSMADIAFLLLIFFLVTTTMDVDKGLLTLLPPWSTEEPPDVKSNRRNVLDILVNSRDQLLVKGQPLDLAELKDLTKKHVNNNGVDPEYSVDPQKAVVSLKNDKGTTYNMYISVQNELKAAYNELRDDYAKTKYGMKLDDLSEDKQKEVKDTYPLRISEAEPEDLGGAAPPAPGGGQ
ncbi:biopolymer transporter ExbD [Sphingobacteriales bacterium UPWRP_1]|nr:biopolymer transporter ExbD [Sphingobacteriales bacterium TSM_CSM]PSJ76606.1 biopolymer transporter ExbD [Sphingobacteriales bacterium UPWRP_1]